MNKNRPYAFLSMEDTNNIIVSLMSDVRAVRIDFDAFIEDSTEGMSLRMMVKWAERLRQAADKLEKCVKESRRKFVCNGKNYKCGECSAAIPHLYDLCCDDEQMECPNSRKAVSCIPVGE